jgi:peptide deformylase
MPRKRRTHGHRAHSHATHPFAPPLKGRGINDYIAAMAIRRIHETPDAVLRQISKPVETFDDELKALVADMFETMYEAPGIGLAAVQVGVPIRLLVIDLQEPENEDDPESKIVRDPRVFVNPEILWHSDSEVPYTEGCLSVPEQYAEVMRPDRIRAKWQDETGKAYEEEIDGLLAVCLQHEMDHLNGVLFIDHLSRLKRDMVLKKLAKWRKEQQQKAA